VRCAGGPRTTPRITGWRAAVAAALDGAYERAVSAAVDGDDCDPSALLLAGWLSAKLGFYVPVRKTASDELEQVTVEFVSGARVHAVHDAGRLVLRRDGQADSIAPFPERSPGELLAEELRRLDHDVTYAEALGQVTGVSGLVDRPSQRVHIWNDPALAAGTAG
jgi:glucose-6-phosphate dehydrogenase assembly protein OpcA